MDPNACLSEAIEALCDGQHAEACEYLADLVAWLAKGGFPPDAALLARLPNALDAGQNDCPKDDPDCLGGDGDSHEYCERPGA